MNQTVDRALSILPLLAEGPADLETVAGHLGVHKSTALRLLRTLHAHGLVHRQPDQRYRLGVRLFSLAHRAVERLDLREIAHPHLLALNQECGHTVHLAVRQDGEVIHLDQVAGRHPVRTYARVGEPVALTVAAVAKLLLADLPEAERRTIAERLTYPAYTERSTPDATAYLAELAQVREQGWASDLGGHEAAVNCLAAPVHGPDGRVAAALAVSAAGVVTSPADLLALRPLVLRTARAVTLEYAGAAEPGDPNPAPSNSRSPNSQNSPSFPNSPNSPKETAP
jgi:DNA-binding IclR family transcriptional regulator